MYFCLRQKASVPHRDEHEKSLTGCVMGILQNDAV